MRRLVAAAAAACLFPASSGASEVSPGRPARVTPLSADYWRDLAPRPADLWGETRETFRGANLALIAAAAGAAGGLAFLDNDMQKPWRRGEELLGHDIAKIGDVFGNPGVQAGVMAFAYTLGRYAGDDTLARAGKSMAETMIFTSLTTLAVKGAFNRRRPDGDDRLAFPSWHASATFGNAAVLAEYYGWKAAVPAYLAAAFVAWTRVEQNRHFVSDVVAGAAIGCIYGHAVSRYNMRVHPAVAVEPVLMENGAGVRARVLF
ncbi:MAG: phosphatase PAP2 family protein [bacterium]|nr:phosphatase PAP2 family protein [bacterium]